jgi:hypothetical protein
MNQTANAGGNILEKSLKFKGIHQNNHADPKNTS